MKGKICRCSWCGSDELYQSYHDNEWGKQVTDENKLFEFLILEGAQAGLSWITILRKREAYNEAFMGFDPAKVAAFNEQDKVRLLSNTGIVRNRLKIESAIRNAALFIEIQNQFGTFREYILSFFPENKPIVNDLTTEADIPVSTDISDRISKDMRKRGFRFFGTTICYSFLQATGFINDHINCCDFK